MRILLAFLLAFSAYLPAAEKGDAAPAGKRGAAAREEGDGEVSSRESIRRRSGDDEGDATEARPRRRSREDDGEDEERPRSRRGGRSRRDRGERASEGRGRGTLGSPRSLRERLQMARDIHNSFQNKLPASDPLQAKAYAVEKAEEENYKKYAAAVRGADRDEREDIEKDFEPKEAFKNVLDEEPSYQDVKAKLKEANQAYQDAEDDFLDAKDKYPAGNPEREKLYKAYEAAKKAVEDGKKALARADKIESARDWLANRYR